VGEDSTYSSHPRDWLVLCSQCLQPLPFVPASIGEAVAPGAVLELASDAHMFCSGTCRGLYWLARSGKSLRAQLEAADGGICAGCGVDCGELLDALVSVSPAKREQLLNERHPALAADPALARPLLERPVRGNCWHGDHVVPVSQGGGEASLRNLQTLCVVCHKAKTRLEARAYGWGSHPRKPVPP
jgi:5-methylcytosine-specific restriction endonuclease McrA